MYNVENNVDEKILKELLRKIGDTTTSIFSKLNEGYENEVYDVKTEKDEYIIRLKRKGGTSFLQEVWAIEQARATGIPVASILLLTKISEGKEETEVMIQNKIRGKILENIKDELSDDEIKAIAQSAGSILRKLHAIKVYGFGERQDNDTWQFADWETYTQNFIDERRKEKELVLLAGVTDNEFKKSITCLENWTTSSSFTEPVLCHGDYMPRHIFVDNKFKVSGIIDFGLFRGNIPLLDIAYFGFCSPNQFTESFINGYESNEKQREKLEHDLLFQKIAMIIKQIGRLAHPYRRTKSLAEIPVWVEHLRENLKKL